MPPLSMLSKHLATWLMTGMAVECYSAALLVATVFCTSSWLRVDDPSDCSELAEFWLPCSAFGDATGKSSSRRRQLDMPSATYSTGMQNTN